MATSTFTNKTALSFVLDTFGDQIPAEVKTKIEGMITQLEKKSGAERKPTARQVENSKLKVAILSEMEPNVLYVVGDILKGFTCLPEDMTSQRLSAVLNQMVTSGEVVKTTEKNKSYFSKA